MHGIQGYIRRFCFRNRRKILSLLEENKQTRGMSLDELNNLQLEKLNRLLNHAWRNVPYYAEMLRHLPIWQNGRIALGSAEQLSEIPFLTKQAIRMQKERLYSINHTERGSYMNSSGGSTGEPVRILQDVSYRIAEDAAFLLPKSWKSVGPYDSEIMIWGAERDTFEGRKSLKSHFQDFLRNRIIINSFKMSPDDMRRNIEILNRHRPAMIRAYADSIYELACFARRNNLKVVPQRVIHSAAGTLHDFMRREIEDVFKCPVYNHYGCREVGSIASECETHDGLHILMMHNFVEVVDEDGNPCPPGQEGEIAVTSLDNYSMPVIRYKIGDLGIMREYSECSCGYNYPRLSVVSGRTSEVFRTRDGRVISPIYFAHLLGVVHKDSGISKFQIIQKDYDMVRIRLVNRPDTNVRTLEDIKDKVRIVMGSDCRVEYDYVDDIETTATGKFRHTISEVS